MSERSGNLGKYWQAGLSERKQLQHSETENQLPAYRLGRGNHATRYTDGQIQRIKSSQRMGYKWPMKLLPLTNLKEWLLSITVVKSLLDSDPFSNHFTRCIVPSIMQLQKTYGILSNLLKWREIYETFQDSTCHCLLRYMYPFISKRRNYVIRDQWSANEACLLSKSSIYTLISITFILIFLFVVGIQGKARSSTLEKCYKTDFELGVGDTHL